MEIEKRECFFNSLFYLPLSYMKQGKDLKQELFFKKSIFDFEECISSSKEKFLFYVRPIQRIAMEVKTGNKYPLVLFEEYDIKKYNASNNVSTFVFLPKTYFYYGYLKGTEGTDEFNKYMKKDSDDITRKLNEIEEKAKKNIDTKKQVKKEAIERINAETDANIEYVMQFLTDKRK